MIVSTAYVEITEAEALARPHSDAWKDPSIPSQQLELTDNELRRWRNGESILPFAALKKAIYTILTNDEPSVLEIGCGVGHGAEIISPDCKYTGVDYSPEFIRVAKARRPWFKFEIMDALSLDYADKEFDIAISSCCILHIVDWRTALAEACRVARRYVILHRTPVSDKPMQYFLKKGYGVEMLELSFNRDALKAEMLENGFNFKHENPFTEGQSTLIFERSIFHQPV